jgi:hypothetical protein
MKRITVFEHVTLDRVMQAPSSIAERCADRDLPPGTAQ